MLPLKNSPLKISNLIITKLNIIYKYKCLFCCFYSILFRDICKMLLSTKYLLGLLAPILLVLNYGRNKSFKLTDVFNLTFSQQNMARTNYV